VASSYELGRNKLPYIPNMNSEDDQNKNPSQGTVSPAGGGGTTLSPGAGIGASTTSPTPSAPGAGGNFATLQTYLNANQGQAEPLAGKITAGIGKQYDTLQGQNQSTLSDINSQVTTSPGYTASNPDVLAQEAANPVSFAGDSGNVKNFQSLLNNTYSGPATAEGTSGYQSQQAAINNAISQGQASTQTEAGRKQLLTQNEARPTTGVTALNSAILTQDPNSLSKVQDAYKPFNNLVTDLSSGAQGINTTIGKEQADAAASNKAANDAIAKQTADLSGGVNTSLANAQNQYQAYTTGANNLGADLQAGKIPTGFGVDQGLADFVANNLTPWSKSTGLPLNYNFANVIPQLPTATAPTMASAATADQYATDQALAKLAGTKYAPILDPNQAALAGTYTAPTLPTALDNQALAGDLAAGLSSSSSNPVSAPVYNQYLQLLADLDKYQGQSLIQAPFGTAANLTPAQKDAYEKDLERQYWTTHIA
jgi:hypothetical protein